MSEEIVSVVRAWLVLSFGEERQHGGNIGYRDDAERVYRYDSFVPNHRQVSPKDLLVIAGRNHLIGFGRIERIEKGTGNKRFLRCPECGTTAIKRRKLKKLLFRCNGGHEFDAPVTEEVECTEYEAHYGDSFARSIGDIPMPELRKACPKYTDQLAIQELDFEQIRSQAFRSAPELEGLLGLPLELVAGLKAFVKHNRVRREDVLAALEQVKTGGVPPRFRATLYELVHDEKRYPAKYILTVAVQHAKGNHRSSRAASGSEILAGSILRQLGFVIDKIGGAAALIEDLMKSAADEAPDWEFNPCGLQDARERVAGEILKRRGQPQFRKKLLRVYGNRCSITGCGATEVLEACHIVPYLGPKTNHPSNGLILRADVHTLFDLDLIMIEPGSMRVTVAPSLRKTDYASLEGIRLRKPSNPALAPTPAAFEERRKWK